MVRALRIQYPGAWYHLLSRGNARQQVFLGDSDYHRFLDLLGETCVRFEWNCSAHCLMPNHYHLLVRTEHANLSLGMRHLNGVFTQRYNKSHRRVGHVFQGRFKALLIQDEQYLVELVRYIVLNPVRAKLVESPGAWHWSAHRWLVGDATAPKWASPNAIWGRCASDRVRAREVLRALLDSCEQPSGRWSRDGIVGGERRRRGVTAVLTSKRKDHEHNRVERFADRPPLKSLLCEKDGANRALLEWGYTQKEIARETGMSEAAVSRRYGAIVRAARGRKKT